ncbi:DUF3263 domain-containing protein [Arcanobacterium hippocoleae]|uniref:DUF3263 domain-containing protein n=1 Tax=Arcanobacterium hippocoleae TaxID=149017 RepID=A0ABU1T3C5_9ACTO|nr:DUF3263 domain-containing protein [Arcanobacterium hippocoleae]MDR6939808.1 hypothetical protein [Arcanobacterium hippocoleae]
MAEGDVQLRQNSVQKLHSEQELADLQRKILQIESGWWKIAESRSDAIKQLLGFSETRYYLILGTLLDSPDFWKLDPPLVDRLRRLRDQKLAERRIYPEGTN